MNTRTKTTAGFQYARNLEGVEGSVTDLYYVVDDQVTEHDYCSICLENLA